MVMANWADLLSVKLSQWLELSLFPGVPCVATRYVRSEGLC